MNLLQSYCQVTKLKFPEATEIIGIASEAGLPSLRSEDLIYLNTSGWSAADDTRAQEIQNQLGLLRVVKPAGTRVYEYPVDHKGRARRMRPSRN